MEVHDFDDSISSGSLITKQLEHSKDMLTNDLGTSTTVFETVDDGAEHFNSSISGKIHFTDSNASNSGLSFLNHLGDGADDTSEDDDYSVEYLSDDDYYSEVQAQFDNVDLPPGVEASVAWLDSSPTESLKVGTESTSVASSSKVSDPNPNERKEELIDDVLRKLIYFKLFDTVEDYSDHFYKDHGLVGNQQPLKAWAKKIQDEWKILEENLPDTIYVRAYESRMDLLRAAIMGPDGTPYHDGLFFFDVMFPPTYPQTPPMVHYHSGGLRLNPNLYNNGKVCLSLLGTWSGDSTEMWIPYNSTMLQVLVSIQALILNAKPFFNEPGFETSYKGADGEKRNKKYNEQVFILSLKTMMYSLKNPPKHFGDLVAGHFRLRAPDILRACRVYSEGAEVACDIQKIVKQEEKIEDNNSAEFKESLAQVVKNLNEAFIKNGSKDCERFESEL